MLRDTTLFTAASITFIDKRFAVGNRSALDDDDVTICCSDLFANNRPITRKPVPLSSGISAIISLREFQLPGFFMPTMEILR